MSNFHTSRSIMKPVKHDWNYGFSAKHGILTFLTSLDYYGGLQQFTR